MEQTPAIYDAHIHLSDPHYAPHMEHILRGMDRIDMLACCVSTNLADSESSMKLASKSRRIFPFVGIHPEFADVEALPELAKLASSSPAGIGEVGLDPTYGTSMDVQRAVFVSQLDTAERLGLPVSIHSRKSLDMVLDILTSYSCRALLHWFDGRKADLRRAADMGLYVSYGPLAVYAPDKRRLLSLSRPDLVLVETDGPVPFSGCFGRMAAQPGFLPSVVFAAAQTLGVSYDEMAARLQKNTLAYLGV